MDIDIKDLFVKAKDKEVLKGLNLSIKKGTIHVIMGPNGVGKSTLSNVLMGNENYDLVSGDITVDDVSIINKTTDERARMGIFLSFQNPVAIDGVSNSEFLRASLKNKEDVSLYEFMKLIDKEASSLNLSKELIHRSINKDFSGGEKKKNEILQMKILKPKFIILDELDSGLDVDSLKIVCDNINDYLKENKDCSVLMITHYLRILNYIKPDYVHVLKDGVISLSGDMALAKKIDEEGFSYVDKLAENKANIVVGE